MTEGDGTDPTLTPSQEIGVAATSAPSQAPTLEPATGKLPARYALGGALGIGGMGEVLLATDGQIGRDVAIKRMRVAATPSAIARFVREAKIQGRLEHPAIVPVHELANDDEGRPFFVMKRLTGTTLAQILAKRAQPRQKLLRAFADVCLAIEFAHSRGIVHRDLKPANIMLGDFGEVYVLDWGVARVVGETDEATPSASVVVDDAHTEAGAILGTPGYIAPEQLKGDAADGRADVYALGCILFEVLAGESLLPRGRDALKAAFEPVDARPSTRAADVPPELDELCVGATAIDRATRPTARELAERIERYLDGDRDLALRKSLAATHVEAARAALAAGDGEVERATAMREAGRAIALDPRDSAAMQLVSRIMLEPPRTVPRAVEARVTAIEDELAHRKLKQMAALMFGFLAVVPTVLLTGLRSALALAILTAIIVVNIALTGFAASRRYAPSVAMTTVSALMFAVLLAAIAREFSPFLLAPSVACIASIMFVVDARSQWRLVTGAFGASVLVPWLLELGGLIPRTMQVAGGDLLLRSDLIEASSPNVELALASSVILTLGSAAYAARQIGLRQRAAIRSVELQAWHLRQLVQG